MVGYIGLTFPSEAPPSTPMFQWLSYSPLDPRFVGLIPAGVDGFFQRVKILSVTSFGWEVKPGSRVVDLRHVKEPLAEIRASEHKLSDFSHSMSEATLMT